MSRPLPRLAAAAPSWLAAWVLLAGVSDPIVFVVVVGRCRSLSRS